MTRTLDRNQDSIQRNLGWNLLTGASVEHGNNYTYYSSHGRLDTVAGSASTFNYGYTANSLGLTATVTGPAHTVTNTWLPDRDALDKKENKAGTTNFSSYDYGVNALGQRGNVETSGIAFAAASVGTTTWGYDQLGQVVSADHPISAGDFGYSFDTIGNRKRSSRNTTDPATIEKSLKGKSMNYVDESNAEEFGRLLKAGVSSGGRLCKRCVIWLMSCQVGGQSCQPK